MSQIVIFQDRVYAAGANRVLKPPSFSKYLSWGFADRSLRIISYEQEKLLSTHENLHDDGPVLCAGFSRDGRTLVTGNYIEHCCGNISATSLISLWNDDSGVRVLNLVYKFFNILIFLFITSLYKYVTTNVKLSGIKET